LAFLSCQAALDALPRVLELMSQELGWDEAKTNAEREQAINFLKSMGLDDLSRARAQYDEAELQRYKKMFKDIDPAECGRVSESELLNTLSQLYPALTREEWQKILTELDGFNTRTFTFNDLLEAISTARAHDSLRPETAQRALYFPYDRSGGGL
jgi:glycerol-3-phosphate dehydrogenase